MAIITLTYSKNLLSLTITIAYNIAYDTFCKNGVK